MERTDQTPTRRTLLRGNGFEWVRNGVRHRDDGPAVVTNGSEAWYRNGELHRDDGPAVETWRGRPVSTFEWWIHGRNVDAEDHRRWAAATAEIRDVTAALLGDDPDLTVRDAMEIAEAVTG